MSARVAEEFERCVRAGGVAVFPSDTVYGLACSPTDGTAVARLYALKGRPVEKSSAVMFFSLAAAVEVLGDAGAGARTHAAMMRLLPGALTLLVPNRGGLFALACAGDPTTLGVRVVSVPVLAGVSIGVMQSSANLSGGPDARVLAEVPESIRAGADLVVDGGLLPGVASTVVDLRGFEEGGTEAVAVIRVGAVPEDRIREALAGL